MSARVDPRLIAGVLAAVGMLTACGAPDTRAGNGAVPTATVPVVRTDIVSRQQLPGTLTYAETFSVINPSGGWPQPARPSAAARRSIG
ncbi:MAG: hypothetical protein E6I84_04820 [Chloroflexi bacterium]|nr:MAG: hypothetical protein E6I84_04820 [Chloroflexota bacterium]